MKYMESSIESFPPIIDAGARLLILGSMPGVASLRAQQYYAHPRNAFWQIMQRILGFPKTATYAEKTAALVAGGIGLWDVMRSCERSGSLDADIKEQSIQPNDFVILFREHPHIVRVLFNGLTAERTFHKRVWPALSGMAPGITRLRLPSTSPAMAGMSFEEKLALWSAAIRDG